MKNRQVTARPEMVPMRLRRQMRLAAGLFFTPWLLAAALLRPMLQQQPALILGLLPGLAVAVYFQVQLASHLADNHRPGEDGRIFATLGAANWLTLLRVGGVVALAAFLPLALQADLVLPDLLRWAPGIIYLGISLIDLLDGFIARKQGRETALGRRLDIEADAAGILVASLVAIALGRLPAVYFLAGLVYYPYRLGIWMRRRRALPVIDLQPRPYARIIAGFQMGFVGLALLPAFAPTFTSVAALVFMTPLLLGFWRDWLVVSGRLMTDADQQSGLDHRARYWMFRVLPPVLRLVIFSGGIAVLADAELFQGHPLWQLGLCFCCLLATIGVLGRSAGLGLALMLGVSPSPLGVSAVSLVVFIAGTALMLTGTGAISLWRPEEDILYRRRNTRPTAYREAL